MDDDKKALLLDEKAMLEKKLRDERIKWSEYLEGEGAWAGHAHSMHESQDTKFTLLEKRIYEIEQQLQSKHFSKEINAEINGKQQSLIITNYPNPDNLNEISTDSPIGKAILEMKKGEEREVSIPKGQVKIKRLS